MSNNIINRVKARQASFNMPVNQEVTRHADGSGGPISINKQTSNQDEYKQENKGERSWYDTFSDVGHTVLDAAGMVPIFGAVADVANAGWYGAEGYAQSKGYLDKTGAGTDAYFNAGLSAAAAIPAYGQFATAAKYGKKGWDAVKFSAKNAPKSTITDLLFGGYNVYNQSQNIMEQGLPSNNTSQEEVKTDNKYENNQRESSRVSQGGENYKSTHEKNYDPNKKAWVKKGGKATGKIADYAVGSDARKKEYDARGWKYDDSIRGDHKGAYTGTKENKPIITPATGVEEKKKNLPYNTYGFGVLPGPK
jgi:hypothetical protein